MRVVEQLTTTGRRTFKIMGGKVDDKANENYNQKKSNSKRLH